MFKNNYSGVSETIGFVIILGIVVTGIALVTLSGYPMLLQQQQNANVRNMEKNMIVLQSEENLLTYKGVPYRETSMQISGGSLRVVSGSSTFSVIPNIYDEANATYTAPADLSVSMKPGFLEYTSDSSNEIIALQNGAVVTTGFSERNSTMLSEPRWFLDNTTLIISLINITSVGDLSSSGIGTVQMSVTQGNTIDYSNNNTGHPPYVEIHYYYIPDGYKDAWGNYFKNQQVFGPNSVYGENTFPTPDIHMTVYDVRRLVIKQFTVTVQNL
jgi:hypothetical protein